MSHQTPPSMMLSAPFTALRGSKVDGSWSGVCGRSVDLPDHTVESAKGHHLEQRSAIGRGRWRRTGVNNIFVSGRLCPVSADTGNNHDSPLVPFGKILGRARHLGGRHAFNGSNKAEIDCRLQAMAANWLALRGFWFARSPWSHRRLIFLSRT